MACLFILGDSNIMHIATGLKWSQTTAYNSKLG